MVETIARYQNIRVIGKAVLITITFLIGGLISSVIMLILAIIAVIFYTVVTGGDAGQANDLMVTAVNSIWLTVPYIILQNLIAIILVLLFIVLIDRKKSPLKVLGLRPVRGALKSFLTGTLLDVPVTVGIIIILLLAGLITFEVTGLSKYTVVAIAVSFIAFLAATMFTAFGEEILFRGYIQPLLVGRYGAAAGLAGTALIFAIPHAINDFRLLPLIGVFLGGLVLGYLVIKTGSLYTSIGFHFLWNFLIMDIFQIGTPIVDLGSYPLFLFSTPLDIIISGINLGRSDELVQIVVLIVFLIALYMYPKNRQSKAVDDLK